VFGKRKTALEEAEPPAREYVSLEQEALERLHAAEARVAAARAGLERFQLEHFLMIDRALVMVTPGTWSRDELDRQFHELMREHDRALTQFHNALTEWAQYKK
jgi:hypothetical protein